MADKATWQNVEFSVHQPNTSWKDSAGIYIFAGVNQQNKWVALYIGQASSLAARLATHERWLEAAQLGATHIHARIVAHQTERDALEKQLIQAYQPRLNVQLKASLSSFLPSPPR